MKKRMVIMLVAVGLLIGGVVGFNIFKGIMIQRFMASSPVPPSTVSTTKADFQQWQPQLTAGPQLRRLWSSKFMLRRMARQLGPNWIHDHFPNMQEFYNSRKGMSEDEERVELEQFGLNHLGEKWQRCGYKFIPLVTEDLFLRCSLDFLVLRPEEPRLIMQSGDLDAKIKTVFDALRLPSNLAETGGTGPQEDETPFYCLLEDDKLISEIRVTSDELLLLPKERAVNAHDVFLVIHVRLQPFQPTFFSNVFD